MTRSTVGDTMTKKFAIALAATAILLAGCGGGGGRPSVDDISSALTSDDNPAGEEFAALEDEQVDCIAKVFHDSDLSDDALNALVDGDDDFEGSDEDKAAMTELTSGDDFVACVTPARSPPRRGPGEPAGASLRVRSIRVVCPPAGPYSP